jgi:multiple sugar transport system substrate-binding protein
MSPRRRTNGLDPQNISRREFLRLSGLVGAGAVIAACSPGPTTTQAPAAATATPAPAVEVPAVISPAREGLAQGMIGGPTGFEGAERYQYGPDTPAGRAIEALRSLPADKKPERLVFQIADGAIGHFDVSFPEGAPTVMDIFREEAGINVEFVGISPDDQFTKIMQDSTTQAGGFDLYTFWGPDRGTLAEAGALANLDEFVERHRPEWEKHYVGGPLTVQQFNMHGGSHVAVSFDGDYQIWIYRRDLFEDAAEQRAFRDRYGFDLAWPQTWEQLDQISEFFTRPDQNLFGATDLRNPFWGYTNWYQRYVSGGVPNQMYFDPDTAQPLIVSPAGIQATQEYVDTLRFHSADALSWGWPEQYANMAAGGAAITCAFPNMPKYLDSPDNPDSEVVGLLRSGLSPGRVIDGTLVRRTVFWPNVTVAVSSQSRYQEAAYLFLQWANSPQVFPWMVANPAGFCDPFQKVDFEDPIVASTYKDYHIPVYKQSIEHAVPPININGTNEYVLALDENLQAAMTGQKSAEKAMEDTAAAWEQITDRLGRDRQIAQLQAQLAGWSEITEPAG